MNIKQLEYFIATAYSSSFSEAASKLYITQPTLSASIASLEKELGMTLFHKQKRGILLTAQGFEVLFKAQKMLTLYNEMLASAESPIADTNDYIHIYATASFCHSILINLTKTLLIAYPKLKVEFHESFNACFDHPSTKNSLYIHTYAHTQLDQDLQWMAEHDYDSEFLFYDPTYIYLNSADPLTCKQTVTLDDLANHKLALINYHTTPNIYPFPDILQRFSPEQLYRFPSLDAVLDIISHNPHIAGIHSLSLKCTSAYDPDLIKCVKLFDQAPEPAVFLHIAKNEQQLPSIKIVKDLIYYHCHYLMTAGKNSLSSHLQDSSK